MSGLHPHPAGSQGHITLAIEIDAGDLVRTGAKEYGLAARATYDRRIDLGGGHSRT